MCPSFSNRLFYRRKKSKHIYKPMPLLVKKPHKHSASISMAAATAKQHNLLGHTRSSSLDGVKLNNESINNSNSQKTNSQINQDEISFKNKSTQSENVSNRIILNKSNNIPSIVITEPIVSNQPSQFESCVESVNSGLFGFSRSVQSI